MVSHPQAALAECFLPAIVLPRLSRQDVRCYRCHLNFHAAQHGIAGERIAAILIHQSVQVRARMCRGNFQLRARLIVAPSVRQADNSWHHFVSNLYFRFNRAPVMRDPAPAAIFQAEPLSIVRIDQSNASRRSFGQDWKIMHPAIVSVELPSSHDNQFRYRSPQISRWPLEVVNEHRRRKFNLSGWRTQHLRHAWVAAILDRSRLPTP